MDCVTLENTSLTIDTVAEKLMEFEQEKKQSDCDKNIDKLISISTVQSQRIKYLNNAKHEWTKINCELQDKNRIVNNQLNDSKSQLSELQYKLTQSKNELKCVQKELCDSQFELKEMKCEVEELKTNLKCKGEKLCNVQVKLDNCNYECNRLNNANCALKEDLKCSNTKLCEANILCKNRATKIEQEKLANELRVKCRKINSLQTQYDEICRKSKEDDCKIKKLISTLMRLKEASLNNHNEQKCEITKLKKENCAYKDQLCRFKNENKQMYKENEILCMEINAQQNVMYEKEMQIKQVKLLSEKMCEIKQLKSDFCPERNYCDIKLDSTENMYYNSCKETKSILQTYLEECNIHDKKKIGNYFENIISNVPEYNEIEQDLENTKSNVHT